MRSNVGIVDRAIRLVLGISLLALGLTYFATGGLAIAAYVMGAVALATGLLRYCPAWTLFGINTRALKTGQNK
jgi:Inner membrane protein YgaP-like, transmembrane domain